MSGALDVNEFEKVWCALNKWARLFRQFDINDDNRIDGSEMRICMMQLEIGDFTDKFYRLIFGRHRRYSPIGSVKTIYFLFHSIVSWLGNELWKMLRKIYNFYHFNYFVSFFTSKSKFQKYVCCPSVFLLLLLMPKLTLGFLKFFNIKVFETHLQQKTI